MLLKPTRSVPHKGGKRMDVGSWQYNLLLRWMQAGAPGVKDKDAAFVALEVEPREIVFRKAGRDRRSSRCVARWSDGSAEDVTPLCRFRSNDEAVATVDETGLVTARRQGRHGRRRLLRQRRRAGPGASCPSPTASARAIPNVPTPTKIDELVVAKLRKLGIVPVGAVHRRRVPAPRQPRPDRHAAGAGRGRCRSWPTRRPTSARKDRRAAGPARRTPRGGRRGCAT